MRHRHVRLDLHFGRRRLPSGLPPCRVPGRRAACLPADRCRLGARDRPAPGGLLDWSRGMSMPTVQVIGIEKSFLRTRALAGVTFDAGAGITGLLGPNGAGKTTLLRMMATVLAPDAGDLRLLGWNPSKADERLAIRRRLGYMPQEPGFHRSFTAFEFVDYIAILKEMVERRTRHDEVRRVLTLVGLESQMGRKIKQLSGGMRRRLAPRQALLGDPDLLVLDEPTAGVRPV